MIWVFKWWYPPISHPNMIISFIWKKKNIWFVGETHHFRKPPINNLDVYIFVLVLQLSRNTLVTGSFQADEKKGLNHEVWKAHKKIRKNTIFRMRWYGCFQKKGKTPKWMVYSGKPLCLETPNNQLGLRCFLDDKIAYTLRIHRLIRTEKIESIELYVWSVGTRAKFLSTQAHWAICRSPAGGSKLQNPTKYNGSRSEGNISIVAITVILSDNQTVQSHERIFLNEWPQSLGLFARSDLFEGPSPNSCRGEMSGGGSSKFRKNQVYLLLGDRLARHWNE